MRTIAFALFMIGCSTEAPLGNTVPRAPVALVPTASAILDGLDLLFVIDDSPESQSLGAALHRAFPVFLETLALSTGLPDLHVGVVTTDLGTSAALDPDPGSGIGSGPGACSGYGKDGVMQSSDLVSGNYIIDVRSSDGSRTTNHAGSLTDAFGSLVPTDGYGCSFEQPLQAARRALDAHPQNAGFLRDRAGLAVIVVAAEDDCSLAHADLLSGPLSELGPLQSFRCTRFGVTCDVGGLTPEDMNEPGPKSGCRANDDGPYLTSTRGYAGFFQALKADPRHVMFGALAGDPSVVTVEMRAPPNGGNPLPALQHACRWMTDVESTTTIDPSVRLATLTGAFWRRYFAPVCGPDLADAARGLAREIRGMFGDACLTRDIASPADCIAFDTRADGREVPLPACDGASSNCFRLVSDASCPGQGLRVEIDRTAIPPPDTMVSLRCKL